MNCGARRPIVALGGPLSGGHRRHDRARPAAPPEPALRSGPRRPRPVRDPLVRCSGRPRRATSRASSSAPSSSSTASSASRSSSSASPTRSWSASPQATGLHMGQWLSLPMILGGAYLMATAKRRRRAGRADRRHGECGLTPLERALRERIQAEGPISVEAYMEACNAYYYATRDPLGRDGDFTTAPEISQMFGEMVGAALADVLGAGGPPGRCRLCRAGAGARDACGRCAASDAAGGLRRRSASGRDQPGPAQGTGRDRCPTRNGMTRSRTCRRRRCCSSPTNFSTLLPIRQFVGRHGAAGHPGRRRAGVRPRRARSSSDHRPGKKPPARSPRPARDARRGGAGHRLRPRANSARATRCRRFAAIATSRCSSIPASRI